MANTYTGTRVDPGTKTAIVLLNFETGSSGEITKVSLANADDHVVKMGLESWISWKAVQESMPRFFIVFEDRTPFDRHTIQPEETGEFRKPLLYGYFKYHVILQANRHVRLDPGIIIDPPPGT